MNIRQLTMLLILIVLAVGLTVPVAAQPVSEVPRLPDGRPDLQGVWDFRTLTPLQRPTDQADQDVLTAEEAAEVEANAVQRAIDADRPSEVRTEPLPVGGNVGGYNNYWFDRGAGVVDDMRTSLIVDPPSGRLPEAKPGVVRQGGDDPDLALAERPVRFRVGGIASDGPEDRGLAERCLLGFNTGPPIVPGGYNQNIQIFQTADHVVILNEMVHDSRIVPLDGRGQLPDDMYQWMGSSRGRWEGDTLVVETTNFTDNTSSFSPSVRSSVGTGTTLHLIERFQRMDGDTLLYEFTVNDPSSFAMPFTAALPMKRGAAPMFEYACHEGNYGMQNLLAGARTEENAGSEQ
ncbi:MAG: hypothetical protein VX453_08440 [Acidobacteriota bacterium]|nr:hypothetical protein [Acidobacteriota bacterium]